MPEELRLKEQEEKEIGFFEKYLTVWVAICIIAGVLIGRLWPAFPSTLSQWEYAQVSIPVAVLIWFMIYPMMVQIDFGSIMNAGKRPKGLTVTLVSNWLIKPFTMYFFGWLFIKVLFQNFIPADLGVQYVAGMILLGSAPCTAMVFVWSYLTDGDPAYTLIQVSINDLVLVFAYAPLVMFLLGLNELIVPWDTILLSVILYIVVPLAAGYFSRKYLIRKKGIEWFENVCLEKLSN